MIQYWPKNFATLNLEAQTKILEERRALAKRLSAGIQTTALQILKEAETSPEKARKSLFDFLSARLDQIPIVSESDQTQIEILLMSLTPED